MSTKPNNSNGQSTMANSQPVTIASDQTGIPTISSYQVINFASSGTGAQVIIPNTDVRNYSIAYLQFTSIGSGAGGNLQMSNTSGGTYQSIGNSTIVSTANTSGFAFSTTSVFTFPLIGNFFQINLSALTSGSVAGTLVLLSKSSPITLAIQNGTWNVGSSNASGSAIPSNIFPVGVSDGTNLTNLRVGISSDGYTSQTALSTMNGLFNGSNFDRYRNNVDGVFLSSSARTTTTTSSDIVNYNGTKLLMFLNVSNAGTGSITPSLQIKDSISGNYFTYWTAASAVTSNGQYAYLFTPGSSGGTFTESVACGVPGRTFRVNVVHNNANSITYSISGVIML